MNSRFGYSKTTFSVKNDYGQWAVYLLGFPLVFLDWKCARGFSFYIAQTWNRFWIPLFFLKIGAVASVYAVMGRFLDTDAYKEILCVFFVVSFTLMAFMNHPWVMKIWLLLVYLVPFIVYLIIRIIIFPFTFCC